MNISFKKDRDNKEMLKKIDEILKIFFRITEPIST